MSKTMMLRKLIMEKLATVSGATHYKQATPSTSYPYKTFALDSINYQDSTRDDYDLVVDVWDRSPDPGSVEVIADQVEALLNVANIPRPPIYPTFFRDGRNLITDPDKTLQHIQMHFIVQLYEEV